MFTSLRVLLLIMVATTLVVGILIAGTLINATSTGPSPDLTTPAAIATATRSLPPYWTIRAGDTFDSVAAANHLSAAQLQALNPTQDPISLIAGQKLRLRMIEPSTAVAAKPVPAWWTVRRGDTFSSISARTGLAIGDIATLNPKANPNLLVPGQRLRLRA